MCNEESYVHEVRKAFGGLNSAGFMEEFVWNYWKDAEPYNVIRSRLWSETTKTWCFVVFHTLLHPTHIAKEGASLSRALRHNVLTDSLGANLFVRNPQNRAVIDEVKLRIIWESIDDDSLGYLDKREMMEVMRQMGKTKTSKQRLDRIFRKMDKDEDGTIDYEEFHAWWKKQKKEDRAALALSQDSKCRHL